MSGLEATSVAEIRQLVADSRPASHRSGYPPDVRRRVVEWARRGREAGLSYNALAAKAGLSRKTLRGWCSEDEPVASPRPGHSMEVTDTWLPVKVQSAATSSGLRWVTPTGHRVEGLGLEEVVHLLRVVG